MYTLYSDNNRLLCKQMSEESVHEVAVPTPANRLVFMGFSSPIDSLGSCVNAIEHM